MNWKGLLTEHSR